MNYCHHCKHYVDNMLHSRMCRASIGKIDIITGEKIKPMRSADEMRHSEAYCGADGRWFEKMEARKK